MSLPKFILPPYLSLIAPFQLTKSLINKKAIEPALLEFKARKGAKLKVKPGYLPQSARTQR